MTPGVCTLSSWVRLLDLAVAIHNMKLGIETGRPVHDSHPKTGVYCKGNERLYLVRLPSVGIPRHREIHALQVLSWLMLLGPFFSPEFRRQMSVHPPCALRDSARSRPPRVRVTRERTLKPPHALRHVSGHRLRRGAGRPGVPVLCMSSVSTIQGEKS